MSFRPGLFTNQLTWWIPGLVLAFPAMFLLDYFTGRLYPPEIDDVAGYALVQQLQLELVILVLLSVITPAVINAVEVFYPDLTQNDDKRETKQTYFSFSFNVAGLKRPIPYLLAVILIVAEKAFIISMLLYLKQYYDRALIDSMDFLIGGPGPILLIAYLLLIIDCLFIFCILLFSFLWGQTWVQWLSDRVFPAFMNNRYYSRMLFVASLIVRALNMLGLIFVINLMVTFSGRFDTVINMIFGISMLLFLWVGIYILPYLNERAASRAKVTG